jgi:argininosuccinate lyase
MSRPTPLIARRTQIYATSDERKKRNREAQAAFRERRVEYVKQLENTIKIYNEMLQNLQLSHQHATRQYLTLSYENRILENALLAKGLPHELTHNLFVRGLIFCRNRRPGRIAY